MAQAPTGAVAVNVRKANHFSLSGGGIHVDYFADGINGRPQLNYHDRNITQSFNGDEITTAPETSLGTLITVTLKFIVDVSSTTFTVLIPGHQRHPGRIRSDCHRRDHDAAQDAVCAASGQFRSARYLPYDTPPGHRQLRADIVCQTSYRVSQ